MSTLEPFRPAAARWRSTTSASAPMPIWGMNSLRICKSGEHEANPQKLSAGLKTASLRNRHEFHTDTSAHWHRIASLLAFPGLGVEFPNADLATVLTGNQHPL